MIQDCIGQIKIIQPTLNAVVDERFSEALEEAKAVDDLIASLNHDELNELFQKKPLLGIPFSTKEGIRVKGWIF